MRSLLICLALAGTAEAKVPRYTRPDVVVDVQLSERTRPYQPAKAIPRPAIELTAVAAPAWVTQPGQAQTIATLERVIADTPDRPADDKAELLFRLAAQHAGSFWYWRQHAATTTTRAQAADPAARPVLEREAAQHATKAKDHLLRAVKAYNLLLQNDAFRNYARMDTALFGYAYMLQHGSYMREARAIYDRLLKDHPNSAFVPVAHLAFGEYFLEQGQVVDAEARFRMVQRFPASTAVNFASHRLGWIQLQLGRPAEALEAWFEVARREPAETALHRAAALDFARAFAQVGKPDKARPAFERVDRALAGEMLEALAQHYLDQGALDRAASLARELATANPAKACTWQYRAARATLSVSGASSAAKLHEIERLARLARGSQDPECRANAIAMTGELARAYHAEALKTRNHETIGYAIELYQAFVESFPEDQLATRRLLAEARWVRAALEPDDRVQRDLWLAASTSFATLAKLDRAQVAMAARAAVHAYLNADDDPALASGLVPALTQGPAAAAIALPPVEQQLVEAIEAAAATMDPRAPELGALRFLEANLYRRVHQHAKAAPIFVALLGSHPGETFAEAAAVLALDSLILLHQLDAMLQLADRLAAGSLAGKPALSNALRFVRSRSLRR